MIKKRNLTGKEAAKLSLYTDDMILYTDNSKDGYQKTIKTTNSVKLQDAKLIYGNLLQFYTLTMKVRKRNFKNHLIYHLLKENKVPRNKLIYKGK